MASKKTLLNEATVRRFMKLAELEPLSRPFLENAPGGYVIEEEEPTDEERAYDEDYKEEGEIEGEEDALAGEEELEVDLGAEEDLGGAADAGMQAKVKEFFDAVAEAATEILGVDTEVESDEGEVEDVEAMDIGPEGDEELEVADLDVGGEDVDVEDVELEESADEEAVTEDADPEWGGKKKEFKRRTTGGVKKKAGVVGGHFKDFEGQNENTNRIAEEITRRVVNRLLDTKA